MNLSPKIAKYLEKKKIKYQIVSHRQVFTAFDKAATLKIKPNLVGKTLILRGDGSLFLALIPGNRNLAENKFKKLVNNWRKKERKKSIKKLNFISEKLIEKKFKGVKVGAIPPFGALWRLPTFCDKTIMNQPEVILNAGGYNFSLKIKKKEFLKLKSDLIFGNFSQARK